MINLSSATLDNISLGLSSLSLINFILFPSSILLLIVGALAWFFGGKDKKKSGAGLFLRSGTIALLGAVVLLLIIVGLALIFKIPLTRPEPELYRGRVF